MGLESPLSGYAKLNGSDTVKLTRELRENGIRVLGSSIVGMEHHTPDNIAGEIDYACSHETDFHQFMLYTPLPGTPLHAQLKEEGRLIDVDLADVHGQWKFNWKHPFIRRDDSKKFLDFAFLRDFRAERTVACTASAGRRWRAFKKYRLHPDLRVRERFEREASALRTSYSALLWAMEKHMRKTNHVGCGKGTGAQEGHRAGMRVAVDSGGSASGPADAVADEAGGEALGARRDIRAGDVRRAPELGGGLEESLSGRGVSPGEWKLSTSSNP